jgi:hypothetical protein
MYWTQLKHLKAQRKYQNNSLNGSWQWFDSIAGAKSLKINIMTQAIYPNDPQVERPVISESFKALADKITAKYGLAPCDPIGWLYAMTDIYNIGFNEGLKQSQ